MSLFRRRIAVGIPPAGAKQEREWDSKSVKQAPIIALLQRSLRTADKLDDND